jgi:phage terminase small subunit
MGELTPKQSAFARIYVETGNASEAYRQSYDVGADTKPETVWNEASRTLANPDVAHRVMELQEAARERTLVTLETLTAELDEDREMARNLEMPAAAISAVMGKAKLHGLIVDKSDNKTKLSADEAMQAFMERVGAIGKRLVGNDGDTGN